MSRDGLKHELFSFLRESIRSQKMIGRVNPTKGLLVDPITVMALLMLGMNTAAMKHMVTREKVHKRFYIFVMVLFYPRNTSSTVSLLGSTQSGDASITPARRNS